MASVKRRAFFSLLFLAVSLLLFVKTGGEMKKAKTYIPEKLMSHVNFWLKNIDCSHRTKTLLTVCDDEGHIYPLEDPKIGNIGDDKGHPLLLGLITIIRGQRATLETSVKLNILLNAFGVFCFGLTIFLWGFEMIGCLAILAGAEMLLEPFAGPDVYSSSPALFCFILVALTILIRLLRNPRGISGKALSWFVVILFLLGFTYLIRQPYGAVGIMSALGLLLLNAKIFRKKGWRGICLLIFLCTAVMTCAFVPRFLFSLRNYAYDFRPPDAPSSHGLSHNIYIGLGIPSNPWGITYNDEFMFQKFKQLYPDVEIRSRSYYRLLWKEYLSLVSTAPLKVLRIYIEKTFRSFAILRFGPFEILLFTLSFLGAGLVHFILLYRNRDPDPIFSIIFAFGLTSLLLVSQGILAWPSVMYYYPVPFGITAICLFYAALSLNNHKTVLLSWVCLFTAVADILWIMRSLSLSVYMFFMLIRLVSAIVLLFLGGRELVRFVIYREPTE
ncbi:MAG: hypothetical protein LHV69_05350 [Elusimicrobia bacterium]|nr:hypothetical protein [Candidatus Obscuribacterium magneticum]